MGAITVGDIIAILSLFIAAVGFSLSFWQYVKNKRRTRAEKAVELARNFADDILPSISIIMNEWDSAQYITDLDKIIDENNIKSICFTLKEFRLLPDKAQGELLKICNESVDYLDWLDISLGHVLNKVEAMAMTLVSGVAEEDVVYRSLHEVYWNL